jgi:ubiquitin related modifier 1
MSITVSLEFLGGLDVILSPRKRIHTITVPESSNIRALIAAIVDQFIPDKKDVEVFLENGTIRPGILTLINDTDWELEGEEEYVLEDGDVVSFTSTLHGG